MSSIRVRQAIQYGCMTLITCLTFIASTAFGDMIRVTVHKANIRLEAGSSHKIIASAKEGDILPVVDSNDKWWKVKLSNDKEGWIFKNAVKLEKEDYHTLVQAMAQEVFGEYLKWATLNEVYLEEYRTARLDVMVTPEWTRLDMEQQKSMMLHAARKFSDLCENDDLLKAHDKEAPYVAFFDRFNTLLGKANETTTVFAEE